eukprot:TRINITY_DN11168_c0_g1_i11.p1 TRINITY_DN11168_c0_g1~~TRINITY_DN11168_c0_g1_i11.p1  ORF type:complete len:512 (-),score=92.70 TRINITY_DN11168_c0_g1_i11:774-2279(-)
MSPFDKELLEKVLYRCSCGSRKPISSLYFCRHCLDLRCGFCVSHEVDSHYCPNCMENMPSAEARLKKNRCANCFDCPHCGHTLSTRASSVSVPSPDDPTKMTAKKVYYLACAFCRWTSRDIGLPDQLVASGAWPEQTNPYSERISTLQEHYRTIAQREKMEKESRRFLGRKLSYLHLSDKYGLSSVAARKRSGLSSLALGASGLTGGVAGAGVGREDIGRLVDIAPATPVSLHEINDLPTELLTDPIDMYNMTTLEQRFAQVEFQPERVDKIYPTHKHLMIKRSQRCRRCEHNLSKPEYNPTSIKFKIQLAAYYHVPEIIIFKVEPMERGKHTRFVIKVVNPTNSGSVLEVVSLAEYQDTKAKEDAARKEKGEEEKTTVSAINPLRQPSIVEATDQNMNIATAEVTLPKSKIYLPPRDDAAEFDEGGVDLAGHVDDRDVVMWRKSNKVGIQLKVKPSEENVLVAFAIQYQYTNTIFAHDSKKEVRTATICVPVFLNLGKAA